MILWLHGIDRTYRSDSNPGETLGLAEEEVPKPEAEEKGNGKQPDTKVRSEHWTGQVAASGTSLQYWLWTNASQGTVQHQAVERVRK
jgi:hypothetical protein